LIENNVFAKTSVEENTITITDKIGAMENQFLRKIYNTINYNGDLRITQTRRYFKEFSKSVTLEDGKLVVEIPLNAQENLYLTYLVLDVDFFGKKDTSDPNGIGNDYIYLKLALLPMSDTSAVSAQKVIEYKTNSSTSVTAKVINGAYNSKNGILKLSFSGFDITNYSRDRCIVRNNVMPTLWETE
jgi:hypothetical protein